MSRPLSLFFAALSLLAVTLGGSALYIAQEQSDTSTSNTSTSNTSSTAANDKGAAAAMEESWVSLSSEVLLLRARLEKLEHAQKENRSLEGEFGQESRC